MYYGINWSSNDVMDHSGILGMKWGRRRYQNKDGSLTPAGRERYRRSDFDTDEEYQRAKTDAIRSGDAETVKRWSSQLDKNEWQEAVTRVNNTVQLNEKIEKLHPSKYDQAMKVLEKSAALTKQISDIANNTSSLYNSTTAIKDKWKDRHTEDPDTNASTSNNSNGSKKSNKNNNGGKKQDLSKDTADALSDLTARVSGQNDQANQSKKAAIKSSIADKARSVADKFSTAASVPKVIDDDGTKKPGVANNMAAAFNPSGVVADATGKYDHVKNGPYPSNNGYSMADVANGINKFRTNLSGSNNAGRTAVKKAASNNTKAPDSIDNLIKDFSSGMKNSSTADNVAKALSPTKDKPVSQLPTGSDVAAAKSYVSTFLNLLP